MAAPRSDVFRLARIILVLSLCLLIKRRSFCSTDVIGLCTGSVSLLSVIFFLLFSSVWVNRNKSITKLSNFYSRNDFVCTLLLLCGDIEIQPGPNNVEVTELMANRGIKVLHQNVRGLFANFEKIEIFLTNFKNTDILTLSETHINTHNNISDLYFIPGYTFLHHERKKSKGGGVGIYISNRIKWKRRNDLEHENIECLWIEIIQEKAKNFLVGTLYRPPSSSKFLPINFETFLNDMLLRITSESLEIILLGDVNIDYLKKGDNKSIKEIFKLHGLKQLVTKATRVTSTSSTLIDCIFTSHTNQNYKTEVIPTSISDHDMVILIHKFKRSKLHARVIKSRNYDKYNHVAMCNDLRNENWTILYEINDVNSAWFYFKNILSNTFNKHAPPVEKRVKGNPSPWITTELHHSMNQRDQALRKARRSNLESDLKVYRDLRNKCTKDIR